METLLRMIAVVYPKENIAFESSYLQDFLD